MLKGNSHPMRSSHSIRPILHSQSSQARARNTCKPSDPILPGQSIMPSTSRAPSHSSQYSQTSQPFSALRVLTFYLFSAPFRFYRCYLFCQFSEADSADNHYNHDYAGQSDQAAQDGGTIMPYQEYQYVQTRESFYPAQYVKSSRSACPIISAQSEKVQ